MKQIMDIALNFCHFYSVVSLLVANRHGLGASPGDAPLIITRYSTKIQAETMEGVYSI